MRRPLFTLAAALSAVLFIAACVLWVRSFGRRDYYSARSSGSRRPAADRAYEVWIRERWIVSTRGVLYAYREDFEGDTDSATVAAIVSRRESEWGTSAAQDVAPRDLSRPGPGVHTRALLGWNWMWVWSEQYALDSRDPREDAGAGRGPRGRSDGRIRVVRSAALIPWWVASPPLGVLPALWLRRRLVARRRRATGRCLACGFDLRATPERCPECGVMPTGKWERA
jgi:hypothetical protein